jgi:hypothetical protein
MRLNALCLIGAVIFVYQKGKEMWRICSAEARFRQGGDETRWRRTRGFGDTNVGRSGTGSGGSPSSHQR